MLSVRDEVEGAKRNSRKNERNGRGREGREKVGSKRAVLTEKGAGEGRPFLELRRDADDGEIREVVRRYAWGADSGFAVRGTEESLKPGQPTTVFSSEAAAAAAPPAATPAAARLQCSSSAVKCSELVQRSAVQSSRTTLFWSSFFTPVLVPV
ncbi:unnamed protein product [Calypogeia fissa]